MEKRCVTIFLILCLTAGAATAGGPGADHYFPLAPGQVYEYRWFKVRGGREVAAEKVKISSFPATEFPGRQLVMRRYDYVGEMDARTGPEKITHFANQIIFDYLGQDPQGVYLHARQRQTYRQPLVLEAPEFLLKNPIQAGATWQGKDGRYRIAAVNEAVQVPAGSFSGCLRVELQR